MWHKKKLDDGEQCCLAEIENKLSFNKEKTNQECKIIWESQGSRNFDPKVSKGVS